MQSTGNAADAWWTFEQVAEYIRAHRPCRSLFEARSLIEARIADGTLPTQYRRPDHQCVPIAAGAWRWARDGGVFEWQGREEQERLGRGAGQLEIDAAAVRRLYPAQSATGSGDQRQIDASQLRAEGAASFRLSHLGCVASQADLERELMEWCRRAGVNLGERTIRDIAAEAIEAQRLRLAEEQ